VGPRDNTDAMEKSLYHRLVGRLVDNELKGIRNKRPCCSFRYPHLLGGTQKNHKNVSQGSRSPR
jgi:hypothetical protein